MSEEQAMWLGAGVESARKVLAGAKGEHTPPIPDHYALIQYKNGEAITVCEGSSLETMSTAVHGLRVKEIEEQPEESQESKMDYWKRISAKPYVGSREHEDGYY